MNTSPFDISAGASRPSGQLNQVAVVKLNKRGTAGTVGATPLTNPEFDVPTTVASYRGSLYLPNARFGIPPEGTEYSINRIDR